MRTLSRRGMRGHPTRRAKDTKARGGLMSKRVKAHGSKASSACARARGRSELGHTLELKQHALSGAALTPTNPLLPLHGHLSAQGVNLKRKAELRSERAKLRASATSGSRAFGGTYGGAIGIGMSDHPLHTGTRLDAV